MNMLDYADGAPQHGDIIPDGSFVALQMKFRPGGLSYGNHPADVGILKRTKDPQKDTVMLDVEATVFQGLHKGRHVWWIMTIDGGNRDDRGQSKGASITKATVRAILESAHGIDPNDNSPAAAEKRKIDNLASLQALKFVAKLGVEDSDKFGSKNIIELIVTPNMPEWREVLEGRDPAPKPRGHRKREGDGGHGAGAAGAKPAWQTAAAPGAANGGPAAGTTTPASGTGGPAPASTAGPAWLNG